MSHETISNWVEKAKMAAETMADIAPEPRGVQVIRREEPRNNTGAMIVDIAEKIRPWLMKMFKDARDENNMLVQPARVHGIALNVAQAIVKADEEKRKKVSA